MKSRLSNFLPPLKRPYVTLAEEHLARCWNKDKAQTYALLAIAEQLEEIKTLLERKQ